MIRVRVAGIVPIKNGFAFMHRKNVKNHNPEEYYTFPGGGQEKGETLEEGCIRELKEEFGIDVSVKELRYHIEKDHADEYFFLCQYEGGQIGSGTGPEFSKDPRYAERGEYLPEVIAKEKVEDLLLLPTEARDMLVKDIKEGKFDSYFKSK